MQCLIHVHVHVVDVTCVVVCGGGEVPKCYWYMI